VATIEDQQKQIDQVYHWLRGNGDKGIFEMLRDLKHEDERIRKDLQNTQELMLELTKTVERLDSSDKANKAMMMGVTKTLSIMGTIFAILGTGGFVWLGRLMTGIASNLP